MSSSMAKDGRVVLHTQPRRMTSEQTLEDKRIGPGNMIRLLIVRFTGPREKLGIHGRVLWARRIRRLSRLVHSRQLG